MEYTLFISNRDIHHKDKSIEIKLIYKAVTMINPVTGWFEIAQYDDKRATFIVNSVEATWVFRYPRQIEITYDQGLEFIGHELIFLN